jgi:hypothetical protein
MDKSEDECDDLATRNQAGSCSTNYTSSTSLKGITTLSYVPFSEDGPCTLASKTIFFPPANWHNQDTNVLM